VARGLKVPEGERGGVGASPGGRGGKKNHGGERKNTEMHPFAAPGGEER